MLGPYTFSPDSLAKDFTGKLGKPEGAEALLLRSMLAAPREDCKMEKVSGVVTHTVSMVVQTAGMPAMKDVSIPRGRNIAREGQGVSAYCVLVPNSLQRYSVRMRYRAR